MHAGILEQSRSQEPFKQCIGQVKSYKKDPLMHTSTKQSPDSLENHTRIPDPFNGSYYLPTQNSEPMNPARFRVIPVSHHFFHIKEAATGKIKGFRCNHNDACELAKRLEQYEG